jgi:hypothetical protein
MSRAWIYQDDKQVILDAGVYDRWLDPSAKDVAALQSLLVPYPDEGMIVRFLGPGLSGSSPRRRKKD